MKMDTQNNKMKPLKQYAKKNGKYQMEINFEALIDLLSQHLYKDKSAVIRELLSNANDSLSIRKNEAGFLAEQPMIQLLFNQEKGTLIVKDNGIGMSKDDLINYLATIGEGLARRKREDKESGFDPDELIGQFGVGFLSSFIIAQKIVVKTRKQGYTGYCWESKGTRDYSISEDTEIDYGTTVLLDLKEEVQNEWTDELIKKMVRENARNFIYPIYWGGNLDKKLNDLEASWYQEITIDEDELEKLRDFLANYDDRFASAENALEIIPLYEDDIRGVIYIPPSTANENIGVVDLYCKRVFVTKDVKDIVPPIFNFIKGIIDCFSFRLTAARDEVIKDHIYNNVTKFIETKIMKHFQYLASCAKSNLKNDEHDKQVKIYQQRMIEIMDHYNMAIKYALVIQKNDNSYFYQDEYLKNFEKFMPFQSNLFISTTIPEYLERMNNSDKSKAISFLRHDKDFNTYRAVAEQEKQEFILIRHRKEEEYLKRYAKIIGVKCLPAQEMLKDSFVVLTPSEGWEQIVQYYKEQLNHPEFRLSVYLAEFNPENVPARLIADEESQGLRRMHEVVKELEKNQAIDKDDPLYKELERLREKRSHSLYINKNNPILRRLIDLMTQHIAFNLDIILHSIFNDVVVAAGHKVHEGYLAENQNKLYGEILSGIEARHKRKKLEAELKEIRERHNLELKEIEDRYNEAQVNISALQQQLSVIGLQLPVESQKEVFFIRPFKDKEDETDYDCTSDEIKAICRKFGLILIDPKYKTERGEIISQIKNHLRTSKFVIADISDIKNANVYYEIGYVHGAFPNKLILIGKENVIINDKVPFDIHGLRIYTYSRDFKKFKKFLQEIEEEIRKEFENSEG